MTRRGADTWRVPDHDYVLEETPLENVLAMFEAPCRDYTCHGMPSRARRN